MKKIIIKFSIFFLVLICSVVIAQKLNSDIDLKLDFLRDSNKNIKEALFPGVSLIKQEYVIVDKKGKEFGLNGLDHFGIQFYLGIQLEESIRLPESFFSPGNQDTNYVKIKNDYDIELSNVSLKKINLNENFNDIKLKKAFDQKNYSLKTNEEEKHFKIVSPENVKEGKLLLFTANEKNLDSLNLTPKAYIIDLQDIEWKNNIADIKDYKYKDAVVIGGVLFFEKVGFANITYQPVAFYEQKENNWILVSLVDYGNDSFINPVKINKGKKKP
ncbi:MAG: hypothetical protein JXQ87_06030 [Bacteroidia bacterium]